MGDVKTIVEEKIKNKRIMVFSKSYCPYCNIAKKALKAHIGKEIDEADIEFWEIENEANCQQIQSVLGKMTGATSVPRVFINGKFVGGGSEIDAFEKKQQLGNMLKA